MATNSKVFVSPGVYTSEVDLSFVAQSVGVTTLGIVGETLTGPAFEPIFITNFDEFSTYFGGTSPEKFINTQIPKYEAAYIAKAYLQQSNQLFVTRILGLSGYDAGPSWSISVKGNVDPSTIDFYCEDPVVVDCQPACNDFLTIDFAIDFSGCTNSLNTIEFLDPTQIPTEIAGRIDVPYELFDGSTSTLRTNMNNQIFDIMNTPSTEDTSIYYYGAISGDTYQAFAPIFTAETNVMGVESVDASLINYSAPQNDSWYYALFDNIGNAAYTGYSFWSIVTGLTMTPVTTTTTVAPVTTTTTTDPCVSPTPTTTTTTTTAAPVNCYTGTLIGRIYVYSGTAYTDYDDVVIATLRSRGLLPSVLDIGRFLKLPG